jgi:hypothetical protein
MQAVHMSDQFRVRGPSTEVETQHLICPLGRCSSDPQADQQARTKGRIHLEAHPVEPLTQQRPAAQDTVDPAEKQLALPDATYKNDLVSPQALASGAEQPEGATQKGEQTACPPLLP